ncbi:MAG: Uma2 family endonuclease [Armatimonadetes bacterium]|nr:Uma2 family endonuclease [Anaerolineae bacterium]
MTTPDITQTMTRTAPLTLEAFMQLGAQYDHAEYIDGEWIEKMPTIFLHGFTLTLFYDLLSTFVKQQRLGQAFSATNFVMLDTSNWVHGSRIPDVMFYAEDRWQAYLQQTPDVFTKPLLLIPDLAVEIVSTNDNYSDLRAKVQGYLRDGVQIVWVVDPAKRQIDLYEADRLTVLGVGDTLDGGALLPGFAAPLADIFSAV